MRGRDAQIDRFRELKARASTLAKHALIDEYVLTLAEVEADCTAVPADFSSLLLCAQELPFLSPKDHPWRPR